MNQCGISCLFLIFAVTTNCTADTETSPDVKVSGTEVTLVCPFPNVLKWKILGEQVENKCDTSPCTYSIKPYTGQHNGLHYCSSGEDTFFFFTRMKVCENCVDLNILITSAIVLGDILLTVGTILIVHLCTRMKNGPAAPQSSTHKRQTSAPTPPDPDYQSLNPATRSKDVYAETKRRI